VFAELIQSSATSGIACLGIAAADVRMSARKPDLFDPTLIVRIGNIWTWPVFTC
jgi:hypothetical protein